MNALLHGRRVQPRKLALQRESEVASGPEFQTGAAGELEAFNVTNYVNYNPGTVNRNINYAASLQRRSARQIQWGLRYIF